MQPEVIADYACECGEGPLWHPFEKRVYWVDIPPGRLFRYDPKTGVHEQCLQVGGWTVGSRLRVDQLGGFTIQADGALLLFLARGAIKIWKDGKLTTVVEDISDERETRFNDVIADPAGRVFCGTMPTSAAGRKEAASGKDRLGRLYRLELDGSLTKLLDGVACSNGCGFTPDRKQMYYTDSGKREIYLLDYDQATGDLSNQRLFASVPEGHGCPDGMTVDAEGFVWSAIWDGGCIIRYAPDGVEERRIHFPAKKVSSLIFGGVDYTDIYVTPAGGLNKPTEGPGAGALFRINLGIKGAPEFLSRVRL